MGIDPEIWDELPWHRQREYCEGFEDEGLVEYGNGPRPQRTRPGNEPGEEVLSEHVHRSGSTTTTEREIHNDLSGKPGEFAALGFREITLG